MSTEQVTQQQALWTPSAPSPRGLRANPWQRVLGLIALLPALLGSGVYVAAIQNHTNDAFRLLELSSALYAFVVAGSLALVWLLVGAVNWQIREASRGRG